MLKDLKKFFSENLDPKASTDTKHTIEYATAALLIELAKSDFEEDELERALIIAMLRDTFDLSEPEIEALVAFAENGSEEANDLFQFTKLVNEHYAHKDKNTLVENLWLVAFADGRLDKYEEQFIRKVSGLLHLSHSEFIKNKITAKEKST
jgi:uncharacterized tellurite resistance protein B-like protein